LATYKPKEINHPIKAILRRNTILFDKKIDKLGIIGCFMGSIGYNRLQQADSIGHSCRDFFSYFTRSGADKLVERGHIKQQVDELYFHLYERTLHPELFKIYKVARVQQRRYQAEIWVLGLSHLVTFSFDKGYVTELIAPHGDLLPKTGLVASFKFRGERDHLQTLDNGLTHIFSSQVERMTAQVFPPIHRDMVREGKHKGVLVSFDEWESDGLAPFSYLDFEARDHEFHIYAFHAFCGEFTLLKTQSIFELGPQK